MIGQELRELKATPKELRKFGLLVGGVFLLLGAWFWYRGKPFYWYTFVPGVPLVGLGAVWPTSLKWVYLGWMSLALVLGFVVSTVLLTVFYYVIMTPVGLIARAVGKDFLSQKLEPGAASYWIVRKSSGPKQRHEYEQQF